MDNIYYYRKSVIFLIVFSVNIKMNLKSGFKKELKNVFLKGLKKRSFYQMEALSGRRSRINFLISSTDLLLSAFEKYRSVYDRFYFTLILILYCTGKTFRAKKKRYAWTSILHTVYKEPLKFPIYIYVRYDAKIL